MKIRNIAIIYSILVGVSMIGIWTVLYITGQIPELQTEPIRITMHITAEIITGILLIIGAIGLYNNRNWGLKTYLLSMGMLLYTLIMSPGYYAQQGEIEFAGMFGLLFIISIAFIIFSFMGGMSSESPADCDCEMEWSQKK